MSDVPLEPDTGDQDEYLDDQLEEGLEDSFPASDPPSVARRHRKPPPEPVEAARRSLTTSRLDPADRWSVG